MPSTLATFAPHVFAGIPYRVSPCLPFRHLDADGREDGEVHAIHFTGDDRVEYQTDRKTMLQWALRVSQPGPFILVSPQLGAEIDDRHETDLTRRLFDLWMEQAQMELPVRRALGERA